MEISARSFVVPPPLVTEDRAVGRDRDALRAERAVDAVDQAVRELHDLARSARGEPLDREEAVTREIHGSVGTRCESARRHVVDRGTDEVTASPSHFDARADKSVGSNA
jgi:hypothetical protein